MATFEHLRALASSLFVAPPSRIPECAITQAKLPCEICLSVPSSAPLRLVLALSSRLDPSCRSAPLRLAMPRTQTTRAASHAGSWYTDNSKHILLVITLGKSADRIEWICGNRGSLGRSTRAMARSDRQPEARRAPPPGTRKGMQSHYRSVSRHSLRRPHSTERVRS